MARSGRPIALTDIDSSSSESSPISSSYPHTSASASAYEYQSLTPHTPRSRAGFSAYDEVESLSDREHRLEHDEDAGDQSSAAPLLPSESESGFRRKDGFKIGLETFGLDRLSTAMVAERLPVVGGCLVAGAFFFLAMVAFRNPGTLEYYVGAAIPNSNSTTGNSSDPSLLISYANYTSFPLLPTEYVSECYKINAERMKPMKYWGMEGVPVKDVAHSLSKEDTCSSTITYMLDGRIGLASDLALMAQVAALARERNRTFFVDDTYWNRGKWTDHFQDVRQTQPGPEPRCLPPPPEELVACPRQAKHWIVNSHTAKFHLSHGFSDLYEDAYAHNLNRLKPIFLHASTSLSQTILPNEKNTKLIEEARKELRGLIVQSDSQLNSYIGVHLRRGDQKFKFTPGPGGYVPIENFVDAVKGTRERFMSTSGDTVVYLASDDPQAIETFEGLISEAPTKLTTFSLHKSTSPTLRSLVANQRRGVGYVQSDFNAIEDIEGRVSLTRGVVVDLALIGGLWVPENANANENGEEEVTPEAVVCTIGSSICLLSALPLSWSLAFGDMPPKGFGYPVAEKQRWVEIDEGGAVVPAWKGFQMF